MGNIRDTSTHVNLVKKWDEEKREKEEKENERPAGELSVGDVKRLIKSTGS
jgi:hypothetical protein